MTRGGEQLYDGTIASVRHFKDDVKEVGTKQECGIVLEDFYRYSGIGSVGSFTLWKK